MDEKIEKDANKWKDILCLWTWRVNIAKIFIDPQPSIGSMQLL